MEKSVIEFAQVVSIGCGMYIHKDSVVATIGGIEVKREIKTFGTFTNNLDELKNWLLSIGVTHVAMESTGVCWKPILMF